MDITVTRDIETHEATIAQIKHVRDVKKKLYICIRATLTYPAFAPDL